MTFADREQAIEAHYALLALSEFRRRLMQHKMAALALAARLGLNETEAMRMANLAGDQALKQRGPAGWDRWIASQPEDNAPPLAPKSPAVARQQSWLTFVFSQLFLLFDAEQYTPDDRGASHPNAPVRAIYQ